MFGTLVSLLVVATLAPALIGVARVRARLLNPPWKVTQVPEDEVICFTLYTVHDGILKLKARGSAKDESALEKVQS